MTVTMMVDIFHWTESSSAELHSNTDNISICSGVLATDSTTTGIVLSCNNIIRGEL